MVMLQVSFLALVLFAQVLRDSPHKRLGRVRTSAEKRQVRISRDEMARLIQRELYGASA